jgi:hypothetical protein
MSCCGPQEKTNEAPAQDGGCCKTDGGKCPCGVMTCNVGATDRAVRTGVGADLVTLAATSQIGPWGWLGALLVISGLIGWCCGYTLVGINTGKKGGCCKKDDQING